MKTKPMIPGHTMLGMAVVNPSDIEIEKPPLDISGSGDDTAVEPPILETELKQIIAERSRDEDDSQKV
ncbi:hypothetical protein QQF64_030179 [Cirrhinus molitorella]